MNILHQTELLTFSILFFKLQLFFKCYFKQVNLQNCFELLTPFQITATEAQESRAVEQNIPALKCIKKNELLIYKVSVHCYM